METNATTNENLNLYEKAENYTKTSLELLKLKTVCAVADVVSTLTSKSQLALLLHFLPCFLILGSVYGLVKSSESIIMVFLSWRFFI